MEVERQVGQAISDADEAFSGLGVPGLVVQGQAHLDWLVEGFVESLVNNPVPDLQAPAEEWESLFVLRLVGIDLNFVIDTVDHLINESQVLVDVDKTVGEVRPIEIVLLHDLAVLVPDFLFLVVRLDLLQLV